MSKGAGFSMGVLDIVRTLTAMAPVFRLCFVPAIGAVVVVMQRRPKLRGMENEGFSKMVLIPNLRASVVISLNVCITLAEALFKEGGDVVGDALELLVALCLGGLEPPGYMASHERHGYGVGTGPMAAGRAGLSLERDWGEHGAWREDEGTWGPSAMVTRLGHGLECRRWRGAGRG